MTFFSFLEDPGIQQKLAEEYVKGRVPESLDIISLRECVISPVPSKDISLFYIYGFTLWYGAVTDPPDSGP